MADSREFSAKSMEELFLELTRLREENDSLKMDMQRMSSDDHIPASGNVKSDPDRQNSGKMSFLLNLIIDTLPQSIFWKDLDGKYLGCNLAFARSAGFMETSGLIGKSDLEMPWLELAEAYRTDDREVINNNRPKLHIIEPLQQADGKLLWIRTSKVPLVDESGTPFGVLGIFEDITEQKRAEEELRKSQAQLLAVINSTNDLIFAIDSHSYGLMTFNESFNKYSKDFFNIELEAGMVPRHLLPHAGMISIWESLIKKTIDEGSFTIDYHAQTSAMNMQMTFHRLYNEGKIFGVSVFGKDVTEQIKVEQELKAAKEKAEESDRLKTAFLMNLSHEIRTPMNVILGFSQLLKGQNLSGEEKMEFIEMIEKGSDRMMNLINQLVDISKIEAGITDLKLKNIDLNEHAKFIHNFFKSEAEKKGLEFSLNINLPSDEVVINTDTEKLYAVIANLVKNAIKFTEKGMIQLGCCKKYDQFEFYVKDTGIGIPKDRQEAIFDRFVQADIEDRQAYQGAGLGLSITRSYLKMLGGNIRVESEPGQGSTFYFTLPVSCQGNGEMSETKSLPVRQDTGEGKLKILVADDDFNSAWLMIKTVEKFSRETIKAKNGHEAVRLCREYPDIDLVLMDIKMPDMDGLKATKLIREFNGRVVIIAQTAHAMKGDRENAIEAGCDDYISKPIVLSELNRLLRKYFSF